MNSLNKKIILSFLLTTTLFSNENNIKQIIKKNNIKIILNNKKLNKIEQKFPLEIKGKEIEKQYLIHNTFELKEAIKDFTLNQYNNVIIECIYDEKCSIKKDLYFLSELINKNERNKINNKITLIKPYELYKFNTNEFLLHPEILMNNINKKELKSIKYLKKINNQLYDYKNRWDLMELQKDKDILTNIFIDKFLFTDYLFFKKNINNENIPPFFSSNIGSKYCNINIKNDTIITNKRCDIPIFEKFNRLFINGYFFVGNIIDKKETKTNFIYKIDKEIFNIKDNVLKYNEYYCQNHLPYYLNIINLKMKKFKSNNKYLINSIKNKKYLDKRKKELSKINKKEFQNIDTLNSFLLNKIDKLEIIDYHLQ
jgi:hypothetical protein